MPTRRDVLHRIGATTLGVTAVTAVSGAFPKADSGPLPARISVQAFHDALVRLEPHLVDKPPRNNLFHAWEVIAPVKFNEFVFVAWCGTRFQPVDEFAEEFARRRRGEPSMLPDHSVFDMPYGNWRIPVYRGHWVRVFDVLTDLGRRECAHSRMRMLRKQVSFDDFTALLHANPSLPDSVQDDDIPLIWDLLSATLQISMPIGYMAMLTGRTLELARES